MITGGPSLEGKRALVLGLGVHGGGLGVVRFLVGQGARVTVTDLRPPEKLQSTLEALGGLPVELVLGEHRERDILEADLVVRNPAVPRESPWLALARSHGVPVLMEMNLFWRYCPAPITAITGSKGKSTTTAWLGHTWRLSRPDTVVAGNLRVSALEALPSIGPDTPVVLELSSWQLEAFAETQFGPH
ncbi:MAG: UDP-N-acetylmuramoyl-L-alanine--D-glutamate ligase, partial [Chloroflexota bacterium]|nr:UDP-N-acetylmuramoyl-L-alanine--D-glutamate ligase [Chloroflexota bacterium]